MAGLGRFPIRPRSPAASPGPAGCMADAALDNSGLPAHAHRRCQASYTRRALLISLDTTFRDGEFDYAASFGGRFLLDFTAKVEGLIREMLRAAGPGVPSPRRMRLRKTTARVYMAVSEW